MRTLGLMACWISLSFSCGGVVDDAPQDDDDDASIVARVIDPDPPLCTTQIPVHVAPTCPSTPTECTKCIIRNRGDILPFYKNNGWKTGQKNRNCIVENWCGIDPVGCALVRANECTVDVCNEPLPPALITQVATTLNDRAEWNAFTGLNQFWNPLATSTPPCQTFVSMIWFLSGFKAMGSSMDGWRITDQTASPEWASVEAFYNAISTQCPVLAPSLLDVTTGDNTAKTNFDHALRVGDVIDYYGCTQAPPASCLAAWKHSVIVVAEASGVHMAKVASMGTPQGANIDWDKPGFDYTKVRVIRRPGVPLP